MPAHAGFAVAIGLRERLLNDALLLAYHSGEAGHWMQGPLPDGPPAASLNFFLTPPTLRCRSSDWRHVEISLEGWGGLRVAWNLIPVSRDVRWQMTLRAYPRFVLAGTQLELLPAGNDIELTHWDFQVLSGTPCAPDTDLYLRSGVFRARLEAGIRLAISLGLLKLPSIDASFLGAVATAALPDPRVRVVDGAVLVGIDVDSNGIRTAGNVGQLTDFTRGYEIATVLNPVAVPVSFRDAESDVRDEVASHGATLESFRISVEEGRFKVEGLASRSEGAVSFSLGIVPISTASRPGAFWPADPRSIRVNAKTWRALGFAPVDVQVSVDRASWVVLVEVIGAFVTGAVIPLFIEDLIKGVSRQVAYGIENADLGRPVPRVRRIPPSTPDHPVVRIEIAEFEIHQDGVFTGIGVRPEPKAPMVIGPTTLPQNFRNAPIRYEVRLPLELLPDDPKLRIRWTVVDLATGTVLDNQDGLALNRLAYQFAPGTLASAVSHFGVLCRVYRTVGAAIEDFLNDGVRLDLGAATGPGTYVRWHYAVKNPQLRYLDDPGAWQWHGESVVPRRSAIHRTDRPCSFAAKRSRYEHLNEEMSTLPFPLIAITERRGLLCDYCFFGGPSKELASL